MVHYTPFLLWIALGAGVLLCVIASMLRADPRLYVSTIANIEHMPWLPDEAPRCLPAVEVGGEWTAFVKQHETFEMLTKAARMCRPRAGKLNCERHG